MYIDTLDFSAVHWGLGLYTQFDLVIQWLKLVQFLLVSHLYWIVATRVTRKECLTNRYNSCLNTVKILGIVITYPFKAVQVLF